MASRKSILCLDLGTQTVSLGRFDVLSDGALQLTRFETADLLADPAMEATRIPQLRIAVQSLLSSAGLKGGPVNYTLPGQSVFTRFVPLPTLDPAKVRQIVGFEAQENVPFPIDEVVWDYQLAGGSAQQQSTEVVLVAIKKDILNEMNDAVESSGLRAAVVDVAPMALYNAFRFNYADREECAVLVDIGSRTTNLIFIEPGVLFSRSIPIGGGALTSAVAKEFGETFAASDKRKCDDGFVNLGGAYEDPEDPDIARLSKVLRNGMTRLHGEITRSIGFYRAQQKGSRPQRIYLCGGSASLPYIREFFTEKFQLPIEMFNPLRNVVIDPSLDAKDILPKAHLLGELVGAALRESGPVPVALNLQPLSVILRKQRDARKPFLAAAAACLLLSLSGWLLYYQRADKLSHEALEKLQPHVVQLQNYERKINKVKSEIKKLKAESAPILQVIDERDFWRAFLNDLNQALPEKNIWVTTIEPMCGAKVLAPSDPKAIELASVPSSPSAAAPPAPAEETSQEEGAEGSDGAPAGKTEKKDTEPAIDGVRICGLVLENQSTEPGRLVDSFVDNLAKSAFVNVTPENRSSIYKVRVGRNEEEWAYKYELYLPLKQTLKLP